MPYPRLAVSPYFTHTVLCPCRVLRESSRGSRKNPNCQFSNITNPVSKRDTTILDPRQHGQLWGRHNNCTWDLSSCKIRKASKTKILDSQCVSRKRRGRRISHSVWTSERRQAKFFKYFRMSTSKFENVKQLLHTHSKEDYTMQT